MAQKIQIFGHIKIKISQKKLIRPINVFFFNQKGWSQNNFHARLIYRDVA